jgi:hypothetical protein
MRGVDRRTRCRRRFRQTHSLAFLVRQVPRQKSVRFRRRLSDRLNTRGQIRRQPFRRIQFPYLQRLNRREEHRCQAAAYQRSRSIEVLAGHQRTTFAAFRFVVVQRNLRTIHEHRQDYRLFAVSVRVPKQLFGQWDVTVVREGLFEMRLISLKIQVIVLNQLPEEELNAMLLLFSTRKDALKYGTEHYRPYSREISTILQLLFKAFREDKDMQWTLPELYEEYIDEIMAAASPEKRLKGLSTEERLKGLSSEELLRAIPPDLMEALARQIKANGSSAKPQ